jgi:hypothetical protein
MVAVGKILTIGAILNYPILFIFLKSLSQDTRVLMLFGEIPAIIFCCQIAARTDPRSLHIQRTGRDRGY